MSFQSQVTDIWTPQGLLRGAATMGYENQVKDILPPPGMQNVMAAGGQSLDLAKYLLEPAKVDILPSRDMMLGVVMPNLMSEWHLYSDPIFSASSSGNASLQGEDCMGRDLRESGAHLVNGRSTGENISERLINEEDILGKVWQMAQDPAECHDLQRILDDSDGKTRFIIALELRGHIWEAIHHPYANFVLAKLIESASWLRRGRVSQVSNSGIKLGLDTFRLNQAQELDSRIYEFIIEEIMKEGCVHSVAQHKFGCRILRRILEYAKSDQFHDLVAQLLTEAMGLLNHRYAIYVVQHVLEYACSEHKDTIITLMIEHISDVCSRPTSSILLGAALQSRHVEDRVALAHAVVKHECIAKAACTRHGHVAVKTILEILHGSPEYADAVAQIHAEKEPISNSRYGRVILRQIGAL